MAWQKGKKVLTKLPCGNSLTKTLRVSRSVKIDILKYIGWDMAWYDVMCVNVWMAWNESVQFYIDVKQSKQGNLQITSRHRYACSDRVQ